MRLPLNDLRSLIKEELMRETVNGNAVDLAYFVKTVRKVFDLFEKIKDILPIKSHINVYLCSSKTILHNENSIEEIINALEHDELTDVRYVTLDIASCENYTIIWTTLFPGETIANAIVHFFEANGNYVDRNFEWLLKQSKCKTVFDLDKDFLKLIAYELEHNESSLKDDFDVDIDLS